MNKHKAIKTLRIWLRPSNPVLKATPKGFQHTCKRQSTRERFIEAVNVLGGQIIDQVGEFVTLASLPSDVIMQITPGPWGGSKLGSPRKSHKAKAEHKLDVRLYAWHTQLLKALALRWYGPRSESKTIRRLIEEAAKRELLY